MSNLRRIYTDIHPHYEKVNRIISLGMDRQWRRRLADLTSAAQTGNWLDLCTGTGETALLLKSRAPAKTRVFAADYSIDMIREFRRKPACESILISLADACSLPFQSGEFKLVTTSFATRNLQQNRELLIEAFREIHRVLAPDGLYISLESSRPDSRVIDAVFRSVVRCLVEPVGVLVSGTRKGYQYLSSSIRSFHHPDMLSKILQEAGFPEVRYETLFFGAAAIHIASKTAENR